MIEVHYSCAMCGLERRKIDVLDRNPDEELGHWLMTTMCAALRTDHKLRSPKCEEHYLKVEIQLPTEKLGENSGGLSA